VPIPVAGNETAFFYYQNNLTVSRNDAKFPGMQKRQAPLRQRHPWSIPHRAQRAKQASRAGHAHVRSAVRTCAGGRGAMPAQEARTGPADTTRHDANSRASGDHWRVEALISIQYSTIYYICVACVTDAGRSARFFRHVCLPGPCSLLSVMSRRCSCSIGLTSVASSSLLSGGRRRLMLAPQATLYCTCYSIPY
jgi:hypothetical protein